MPEATIAPARRAPALLVGLLLIGLAIIVFVLAVARGSVATSEAIEAAPVLDSPGALVAELQPGDHALWISSSENLRVDDITVTGPSGPVVATEDGPLVIRAATGDEDDLQPQVWFRAPVSGPYTVTALDTAPDPAEIVVAPATTVGRPVALVTLVAAAIGVVLVLVGLVDRVRDRSSRPPSRPGDPVLG